MNNTINSFLNKEKAQTDFLKSTGNKLISYGTCIAEWLDNPISVTEGDIIRHGKYNLVINSTIYSIESLRHVNTLLNMIKDKHMYLRVNDIPKGTQKLWEELK